MSRLAKPAAGAALWVLAIATAFAGDAPPNESQAVSPYDEYVHACRPGPWGELQYTRIVIEPPEEFLASDYASPDQIRWVFPGYTGAALDQLWTTAGLTAGQRKTLDAVRQPDPADKGLAVMPPADLVLALSPAARETIYAVLSNYPENPDQAEPFRFAADAADEWFTDTGLAPKTVSLVKRLLYQRGSSLLFSDQDVVLPQIASRAERVQLVRTLARKSTLLVKLRVKPDSDIDELARYWGRGPRSKDMRSLLLSISRRSQGITIDITHLLPRFARAHLFTYPEASDHAGDASYDCHWTSLNFFNDPPDSHFADAEFVKRTLDNDYVQVNGPPLLGDVLMFFRPDGKAIHSCVYIADDIVFTKNGSSQAMPWILMTVPDVVAFYPSDPPLKIGVYRRNSR